MPGDLKLLLAAVARQEVTTLHTPAFAIGNHPTYLHSFDSKPRNREDQFHCHFLHLPPPRNPNLQIPIRLRDHHPHNIPRRPLRRLLPV